MNILKITDTIFQNLVNVSQVREKRGVVIIAVCLRLVKLSYNVIRLVVVANFGNEYFRLLINALRKIILILADILQLNKTTVVDSCGCFRKII